MLLALVVGCSKPPTQVTPIAPVKPLPPSVEAPSLEGVAEGVVKVKDANTRLKDEVAWYQKKNFDLSAALRKLETTGAATQEELAFVRQKSEEMEASLVKFVSIVKAQEEEISVLTGEVHKRSVQLGALTQERDTLKVSLTAANTDLGKLTEENKTVKTEGDEARSKLTSMETLRNTERTWKWRFFWWGLGASILFVGSWAGFVVLKSKGIL